MNEAERVAAARARERYGVLTFAQARASAMSARTIHRRVASGHWEQLFPGVYRLPGAPASGRQLAMAAVLWAGPLAVVSHTTAARLLRLDGVAAEALHLTVPRRAGLRTNRAVLHRSGVLPRTDRTVVDGIACTSATRTIIDCAALLDDETLEVAFESARRMRLTSPRVLAMRTAALCGSGKAGSARVRRLLDTQEPAAHAAESVLEVKTARLLRASGLPPFVRQHPVGRYRIDFACPDVLVGVECDGFEHHGYRLAWKRDRRRIATIERDGWRLVFVTWDDVTRYPEQTLERIALALRASGWARR